MPRLRHGAAGDIGARVEMQDCHIGYDSYLDPAGCVSAGAAAVASHAFYGVRHQCCDKMVGALDGSLFAFSAVFMQMQCRIACAGQV